MHDDSNTPAAASPYDEADAWKPVSPLVVAGVAALTALIALVIVLVPKSSGTTASLKDTNNAAAQDSQQEDQSEASEESDEQADQEPEPEQPVEPRAVQGTLEGNAAEAVSATNAFGILTQAVGAFEDKGYVLSFVVRDLGTGNELTYNADRAAYPASSIKGPYVISLYERKVEPGDVSLDSVRNRAEQIIVHSDNEAYRSLHNSYGGGTFAQWLEDANVGAGTYGSYASMTVWNYPHVSAAQLARMWEVAYAYLSSNAQSAQELTALFESREVSPTRDALGTDVRIWGKAGWYESYGEYGAEPATVEAGIVFADSGPYVLSVMSNAPGLVDELVPVISALNRAHQDMA